MMLRFKAREHDFLLEKEQPKLATIPVRLTQLSSEQYIGSNAFGATRAVEKVSAEEYGLAMPGDSWLSFGKKEDENPDFTFFFQVPLDQARAFKGDSEIVLVCRLRDPWIYRDAHGHDATIDDPTDHG